MRKLRETRFGQVVLDLVDKARRPGSFFGGKEHPTAERIVVQAGDLVLRPSLSEMLETKTLRGEQAIAALGYGSGSTCTAFNNAVTRIVQKAYDERTDLEGTFIDLGVPDAERYMKRALRASGMKLGDDFFRYSGSRIYLSTATADRLKQRAAADGVQLDGATTLLELLQTQTLTGWQAASLFRQSPLSDGQLEGRVLGVILAHAFRDGTPVAETGMEVPAEWGTARAYLDTYAANTKKTQIPALFRLDQENPQKMYLGPELTAFVKARTESLGVTLK